WMGNHHNYYQQAQGVTGMHRPGIVTAIPKRRYKFGEFTVAILGDIESNDGKDYRYIAAVIKGADTQPGVYITAEQDHPAEKAGTDYNMRIVMQDGAEVIGSSSAWHDLDTFATEALGIVGQLLNLGDEEPYKLM
ncbi:MAG: hypothetical protein OEN52_03745, partial [Gammaproteobacteria bacterium]|nr:hypothetical protein [Gammaproteobacteria bacterium]